MRLPSVPSVLSLAALLAYPALVPAPARAASARDALLVSPAWLAQHLHDPDLVLLHVGDADEYAAAHLPGARLVKLGAVSVSEHSGHGLMLEMPAADKLRAGLEGLGISDRSRVVVYFAKDWVSAATRVVFTLDYAGLGANTSLLDGGQNAWTRDGHEVTAEVPAAGAGKLSPLQLRPEIVDAEFVRAHLGRKGFAVVDAREAMFYDGVESGESHDGVERTGHVAGAGSFPVGEVVDADLKLKPAAELEALLAKAGVAPGDTVIGYCHIGQYATAMLFAARSLGHPVLLYDGSFEDWSRHAELPVDNPAAKAKS
jgi:thiosulfate/3-mercaptopyruvate sulfurtransferase